MEAKKLIPYSVYLPEEHVKKIKELAKKRKAAKAAMEASKSNSVRIPAEIGETAGQTVGYSLYN